MAVVTTGRPCVYLAAVTCLAGLAACGSDRPANSVGGLTGPSAATASLSGTVHAGGQPIAAARVDIVSGADLGATTTTDAAGRYVFPSLRLGPLTLRASSPGFAPSHVILTLNATQVADVTLTAAAFTTTGRVVDALTQAGLGGMAIDGTGVSAYSDPAGAFSLAAGFFDEHPRTVTIGGTGIVRRVSYVRVPGPEALISLIPAGFDLAAFDQMLRAPSLRRWVNAPPLVIERRALQFVDVNAISATARPATMSDEEAEGLAYELSAALPHMTGGAFTTFARVDHQTSADGAAVPLLNPGQITVARVVGLTASTGFWGYGRWQAAAGTVVGGLIMLDWDFERSGNPYQGILRVHELGHALGYNHVTTRTSIMNSSARSSIGTFDIEAFRIAFQRPPGNQSPDTDPDQASVNVASMAPIWGPPIR